jgi:hypothetical protein
LHNVAHNPPTGLKINTLFFAPINPSFGRIWERIKEKEKGISNGFETPFNGLKARITF